MSAAVKTDPKAASPTVSERMADAAGKGFTNGQKIADTATSTVANGTKQVAGAVNSTVGAVGDAVSGSGQATDDDTPETTSDSATGIGGFFQGIWAKLKKFFSSFSKNGSVGNILGFLLGIAGAWFAGNFFGGGILSTILTIGLALPLALAGSDTIGGWINGKLGTGNASAPTPDATGRTASAPTPEQDTGQQVAPANRQPVLTLSNEAILAMINDPKGDHQRMKLVHYIGDPQNVIHARAMRPEELDTNAVFTISELRERLKIDSGSVAGVAFVPNAAGQLIPTAVPKAATAQTRQ